MNKQFSIALKHNVSQVVHLSINEFSRKNIHIKISRKRPQHTEEVGSQWSQYDKKEGRKVLVNTLTASVSNCVQYG